MHHGSKEEGRRKMLLWFLQMGICPTSVLQTTAFRTPDNDPDYIPPVVGKTSVLNTVTSIPDDSDSCSEETDDVSARLTPC